MSQMYSWAELAAAPHVAVVWAYENKQDMSIGHLLVSRVFYWLTLSPGGLATGALCLG